MCVRVQGGPGGEWGCGRRRWRDGEAVRARVSVTDSSPCKRYEQFSGFSKRKAAKARCGRGVRRRAWYRLASNGSGWTKDVCKCFITRSAEYPAAPPLFPRGWTSPSSSLTSSSLNQTPARSPCCTMSDAGSDYGNDEGYQGEEFVSRRHP
ncbi:hypothetical protein AAT19DRAFT_8420 [Rhodotorula toruloides]|uniref:Uncharacterized protein n=1 Tax=Rhodotorula toruloides TaxID=5286 RepID=A0A2T0AH80_RHOTO|nr:hypothetical protein AAT19DRAFT_8420 [Rhodotorula toruloides]